MQHVLHTKKAGRCSLKAPTSFLFSFILQSYQGTVV